MTALHKVGSAAVITVAAALAACGGGGGGSDLTIAQPGDAGNFETVSGPTQFQGLTVGATYDQNTNTVNANLNPSTGTRFTLSGDGDLHIQGAGVDTTFQSENNQLVASEPGLRVFYNTDDTSKEGLAVQMDYAMFGLWDVASNANWTSGNVVAGAFGYETAAANIPTTGGATYDGAAVGFAADNTGTYTLAGAMELNANFANRTVSGRLYDMESFANNDLSGPGAAWNTVTLNGSWAAGSNQFNGTTGVTGANANRAGLDAGATGTMAGRFYGGAGNSASEVGGVWGITDANTQAGGSFGGRR